MKTRAWPLVVAALALATGFITNRHERVIEEPGRDNAEGLIRERWMMMTGGDPSVGAQELLDAKAHVEGMPVAGYRPSKMPQANDAGLWNWDWLGPTNFAGRCRAILFDPADPNHLWVGAATGGIWESHSGGSTWSAVNDFLPSLSVTTLVVDAATGYLYAGTGEVVEVGTATGGGFVGAGIFRSVDGGFSWQQLPSTKGLRDFWYVSRLVVVPGDQFIFASTATGLFRSGNDGETWTMVLARDNLMDVEATPTTHTVLVGAAAKAYRSTDSGASWDTLTTGIPGLPSGGRIEFAMAADQTTFYASVDQDSGQVWRSTDAGATWELRDSGSGYLDDQGGYSNSIWVDPTNPDRIIVGGIDSWISADGGSTLSRISEWYWYPTASAHADHHFIVQHPGYNGTTNRTVYFANDGGVQRKDDILGGLLGWVDLSPGLGTTQFYKGAVRPGTDEILGGLQDNGTLRAAAAGSWSVVFGGDGGYCAYDAQDGTTYLEYQYMHICKIVGGVPLLKISGLTDAQDSTTLFIAPFKADAQDSGRLVAGGASVWMSLNAAESWSMIRGPQPSASCSAVELVPGTTQIWVGYTDGRVSRSQFNGLDWTDLDDSGPMPLPDRWVTDFAVSPGNTNEAYVTFGGFRYGNVWYTSDGGSTWQPRSGSALTSIPAVPVETITIHPANPNWIYAGTSVGLLASEDGGLTWGVTQRYPRSDGPAYTQVSDLQWQGIRLVAFTYGRGVFRCTPLDVVYVDQAWGGEEYGTAAYPFNTFSEGVAAAGNGSTISVRAGHYSEGALILQRRGRVLADGGTVRIGP